MGPLRYDHQKDDLTRDGVRWLGFLPFLSLLFKSVVSGGAGFDLLDRSAFTFAYFSSDYKEQVDQWLEKRMLLSPPLDQPIR